MDLLAATGVEKVQPWLFEGAEFVETQRGSNAQTVVPGHKSCKGEGAVLPSNMKR